MFANQCLDNLPKFDLIPSYSAVQGSCGEVIIILREGCAGAPVDLTQYGFPIASSSSSSSSGEDNPQLDCGCRTVTHGIELVAKEMPGWPMVAFDKLGVVFTEEEAKQGIVHLFLERHETAKAGIWAAQALIWVGNCVVKEVSFFFEIKPNMACVQFNGPLTVPEVRMYLRDRCPSDNFLLDALEFAQDEIMMMIRSAVDEWNETPPPVSLHTPIDFPYRYHWARSVMGELFLLASKQLRRNRLAYSAGGVSIDDLDRWKDYERMGQEMKTEWRTFIRSKKIALNIEGGYAGLGGYRWVAPR